MLTMKLYAMIICLGSLIPIQSNDRFGFNSKMSSFVKFIQEGLVISNKSYIFAYKLS